MGEGGGQRFVMELGDWERGGGVGFISVRRISRGTIHQSLDSAQNENLHHLSNTLTKALIKFI